MYCITDQYLALASVTGQFGQVNLTTFQANNIENSLRNILYLYLDLALEVPHRGLKIHEQHISSIELCQHARAWGLSCTKPCPPPPIHQPIHTYMSSVACV